MNTLNRKMLQQIHNKLKEYKLREGFKSINDFKVSKVVNPASITKWAKADNNRNLQTKLFKAAKNGDKSALEYIFYKMEPTIQNSFWSKYLGPNKKMQRYRIEHEGAWEDWLGIAWQTLYGGFNDVKIGKNRESKLQGAAESFNIDKISVDNVFPIFGNRYKLMLLNSARNANYLKTAGGLSGPDLKNQPFDQPMTSQYEPTWYERGEQNDLDNTNNTDSRSDAYEDNTFEATNIRLEVEAFLPKWKSFAQDPQLQTGTKGVNIGSLFFEAISDPNASYITLAQKFKLSRNTVATNLNKAAEVLKSYNINHGDLMQAIKVLGNDKVSSYFGGTSITPIQKKDIPKEKTVSNIKELIRTAIYDPKMWKPHVKNADAGNVLFWWIKDNFPTLTDLATEYHLSTTDTNWFFNRAIKILKKHGIDEAALKDAVKKYGKKAITNLIGENV